MAEADKKVTHSSGVPVPDSLAARFQQDIDWQANGWKYKWPSYGDTDNWGPGLPSMSRNVSTDETNRQLVVDTALFYVDASRTGTQYYRYAHHHHPDWTSENAKDKNRGIDCSNFIAHCLNVALGIRISSNVKKGANMKLNKINAFTDCKSGDIVYFSRYKNLEEISHCGIVISVNGKLAVAHSTSAKSTKNDQDERDHSGPQITISHKFYPINRFKWGFSLSDILDATENKPNALVPPLKK